MAERISNREIAERTGLHRTAISRLRNGERVPTWTTIHTIRKEFDLSGEEFFIWCDLMASTGALGSGQFLQTLWG